MQFTSRKILQSIIREGETTSSSYYPVALAIFITEKRLRWSGYMKEGVIQARHKHFMISYIPPTPSVFYICVCYAIFYKIS